MNKIISKLGLAVLLLAGTASLTSCEENDFDMIGTSSNQEPYVTSRTSVGEVNATILEVKERFCSNSSTAYFVRNTSNFYSPVTEDIVITGVVVANDISGNLYQTLLLRNIEPSGEDQCIILGVKSTCLYPYFQLGQRIKVNLKGLWVGVYSRVPRIGQPTKSSFGNLNLGPMLFELLRENVELVGRPDPNAPELVPIDLTGTEGDAWLRAEANRKYYNTPRLATVQGSIREVKVGNRDKLDYGSETDVPECFGKPEELSPNGKKIFAPYNLHDAGMGVDRTIELYSNNSIVSLRTSTKIDLSYKELPEDGRNYTGILTYYDNWQIQLRDLGDIIPNLP
ncbi:MAG: DUF5689 domain-containing protein [Alloprevotella sp.]